MPTMKAYQHVVDEEPLVCKTGPHRALAGLAIFRSIRRLLVEYSRSAAHNEIAVAA